MAEQISYLIIGNGITGVTAAEILRTENLAASIAVIADDPFPVYYRPALKDYLGGRVREDKLLARPSSFYQDRNIYFMRERVTRVQVEAHSVQVQSGREIGYKRLLLAHGARASTLRCPGMQLAGVTTLRSVSDYQRVLEYLNMVQRVVVVGSGTLALETIETLRHRGYDITHLLRRRTLWSEVLDLTASDLILQQEKRDGVDVCLKEEIVEITGQQGRVTGIMTNRGKNITCQMVIMAIGIEPIIDFVQASGIACGRGIRVDEQMRSSAPDVYAAGDVLETEDAITGKARVIGQWYPAIQQARTAAYSMLDLLDTERMFRSSTFYNATFLYGLDFASVGVTNASGLQEIIAPPKARTYRKVLLKDGIAVGMLSLGDRSQALAFKRAIDHRVSLSAVASQLFDDEFKLAAWLDRQGVAPVLLGANRAGAIAVKAEISQPYKQAVVAAQAPAPVVARQASVALKPPPVVKQKLVVPVVISPSVAQPSLLTGASLVHEPDRVSGLNFSEIQMSETSINVVGRQPGFQVCIEQGSVSRRHAEINYANGQYVVQDLESTNGTFVNEQRLQPRKPYVLKQNDMLRFGNLVKFKFVQRSIDKQEKRLPSANPSMAGIAPLEGIDGTRNRASQIQPVLNADGSLLLPGAARALPANVVLAFKEQPALVVLTGAVTKEVATPLVFMLKQDKPVTIGRSKDNDIELADVAASRSHAEVFPGAEGFYIRDLGSSNGATVNQTKINNPYLLSHGDRVVIGGSFIYFLDLQSSGRQIERVQTQLLADKGTEMATRSQRMPDEAPQPAKAVTPPVNICTQCDMANTSVARFCARCSAPLVRRKR